MLQLLKGLVGDFDFSDKVRVNMTSKLYLLVMRLIYSEIPSSYVI